MQREPVRKKEDMITGWERCREKMVKGENEVKEHLHPLVRMRTSLH
jgi:hypothetical protein